MFHRPFRAKSERYLRRHGTTLGVPERRVAYRTALALAAICLFAIVPALWHLNLSAAPGWARLLLLSSLLQLAFVGWMASIPDRASMWVLMIVMVAAATAYGAVASIALVISSEFELPLDLSDVRWPAFWWSALMMALSTAAAFHCGHTAQRWKRSGV
jgi:hypothetical protein